MQSQQLEQQMSPKQFKHREWNIGSIFWEKKNMSIAIYEITNQIITTFTFYEVYEQYYQLIINYLNAYNVHTILLNQKLKKLKFVQDILNQKIKIFVNPKDYELQGIENNMLMFNYDLKEETENNYPQYKLKEIKLNILKSTINWHNIELVKCVGSLTYHLIQQKIITRMFRIKNIFHNSSNKILRISQATYEFLDIIKEEIHPSMIKGKGKSKEGFTVYNLYLSYICTQQGRKQLLNLFLNPTYNKEILQQRYATIEYIHKNLLSQQKSLMKHLKKIHNLIYILNQFQNIKSTELDWRKLKNSIENFLQFYKIINTYCNKFDNNLPSIFRKIFSINIENIMIVHKYIDNTLSLNPFEVKQGINSKLDSLKHTYLNLEHLLTLYATSQCWEFEFKIIFMTQIGYLIKIPITQENENIEFKDWNLQFTNSNGNFYSNPLTQLLDEKYGDVYGEIQDIQKQILGELQEQIKQNKHSLIDTYIIIGEFDCLFALSQVSKNFVKPKISSTNLVVLNGWHILLGERAINNNSCSYLYENKLETSIYNSQRNLVNSNYSNRCIVLSGANGSGKTLYLKQVSVIFFLAHIGSYVPAELAQIPLIDQILSLNSISSVYNTQAGFKQELFQLNSILKSLTVNSLLLIDQIGHAASHKNSIIILSSILKYITTHSFPKNPGLEKKIFTKQINATTVQTPLAIIITHFLQIFNKDIIHQSYNLRSLSTLINFNKQQLTKQTQIRYQYKIIPGLTESSHAIETCKTMGLNSKFIKDSEQYHLKIKNNNIIEYEMQINQVRKIQKKIAQFFQSRIL